MRTWIIRLTVVLALLSALFWSIWSAFAPIPGVADFPLAGERYILGVARGLDPLGIVLCGLTLWLLCYSFERNSSGILHVVHTISALAFATTVVWLGLVTGFVTAWLAGIIAPAILYAVYAGARLGNYIADCMSAAFLELLRDAFRALVPRFAKKSE
jgi:hypothetical protein